MNDLYRHQVALLIKIMPSFFSYMEEKQFEGMSDIPFSYSDYEKTRSWLVGYINDSLTDTDKQLLLSFEQGCPDWSLCSAGDLSVYPSVKWKLQNIEKLKSINKKKFEQSVAKLKDYLLL